eukprot:1849669-Rhodomonas_salina.3
MTRAALMGSRARDCSCSIVAWRGHDRAWGGCAQRDRRRRGLYYGRRSRGFTPISRCYPVLPAPTLTRSIVMICCSLRLSRLLLPTAFSRCDARLSDTKRHLLRSPLDLASRLRSPSSTSSSTATPSSPGPFLPTLCPPLVDLEASCVYHPRIWIGGV